MAVWDTARVKSQLRLTAQRLGQIQDKLDSQGQITRRDIATLLQQGNVSLARAKAQKIIRDDIYGDLLQTLERHVGVVLEHFGEFERSEPPSPPVVEAASSIIYAAPHVESRDLQLVRDLLIQRLGPDFARSATNNKDGYVSARTSRDLESRPPTAIALDAFLLDIAKTHNVQWSPDWQPHQKVDAISAMLDPSSIPTVNIPYLRDLCSHGLPEYPPWLRPKVWRLLLGTLPPEKAVWGKEARKQRDNYYDLVRRLLEPFTTAPPPTSPLSPTDAALVAASKELIHVPRSLLTKLEEDPEDSELCPLNDNAPEDIRVSFAIVLDERLRAIREFESQSDPSSPANNMPEIRLEGTPEIRLEATDDEPSESQKGASEDTQDETREGLLDSSSVGTPEISLSAPDSPTSTNSGPPTTLVPSRVYGAFGANPKHETALIRLLYIHSSLNPAQRSPQVASLLVSLYSAMVEEVVAEDAAHIEADAFWLFEAFVSEFAELEETEGAYAWMGKLGERMLVTDAELTEDLQAKNLDPALPHYSYRWLTTILTHTLPLPAVLSTWDALFSRPPLERNSNPRLDFLVDVCVSMLICARGHLFRLGKRPTKPLNLWGESTSTVLNELLSDREIEEAFIQGMSLLQSYPVGEVGGIERILQLACDLASQREREQQAAAARAASGGLGARLRNSVWRATASTSTPPPTPPPVPKSTVPPVDSDSDTDTDSDSDADRTNQTIHVHPPATPDQSTFASRLASSVWKGITNQSAMETPPTPTSPSPWSSPAPPPSVLVQPETSTPSPSRSSFESASSSAGTSRVSAIWGYAEKLRDSDAAAKLAKTSTNWRVKALDAWNKRGSALAPNTAPLPSASSLSPDWVPSTPANRGYGADNDRRSSLPVMNTSDDYSPPARPAFFRPVRDSIIVDTRRDSLLSPTGSDFSAHSEGDIDRLKKASMISSRTPSPRSAGVRSGGPRPLLLGSGSVITHSRSPTLPSTVIDSQFADAVRAKRPISQRTSQSSISSLSPSEHASLGRTRLAEVESRKIPLNRRSVSPMPGARMRRQESMSSATSSPATGERHLPIEAIAEYEALRRKPGWKSADARDSMTSTASIPSPPFSAGAADAVRVMPTETQRGSVVLSEFGELDAPLPVDATPKISRKVHSGLSQLQIDDSSDSSAPTSTPSRSPRIRSKRHPPRLNNLRLRGESRSSPVGDRAASPNTLAAEWPEEPDATTPRATSFEAAGETMPSRRPRKISSEGRRKNGEIPPRTRKVSSESRDAKKSVRDSAAVEGDDEGYDELLSAYESEDSAAR